MKHKDKKKQEATAAARNGSDDFYNGIPRFNDSFPHKSRSVKLRHVVAKVGYFFGFSPSLFSFTNLFFFSNIFILFLA